MPNMRLHRWASCLAGWRTRFGALQLLLSHLACASPATLTPLIRRSWRSAVVAALARSAPGFARGCIHRALFRERKGLAGLGVHHVAFQKGLTTARTRTSSKSSTGASLNQR